MEIELPDELSMLRDMVRRFVDEELIPIEGKSLDGQKLKPEIGARLTARCKELGLWQIDVPKELGGQGLGVLGRSIVWSELGRTVALPTRVVRILGPDIRAPLYALEGEMRERYLIPTARGERQIVRHVPGLSGLWAIRRAREELVQHALAALHVFQRDVQYIVADGKVQMDGISSDIRVVREKIDETFRGEIVRTEPSPRTKLAAPG